MSDQIAVEVIVKGRVQGVSYRAWTCSQALQRHLQGWVRNCPDGTVQALLQGNKTNIDGMLEAMHQGPPAAVVEQLVCRDTATTALQTFEVTS